MRIDFIGNGLHGPENSTGHYLSSSLLDTNFDSLIAFSAFTKMSGINVIKKELLTAIQRNVTIKFYLGIVERGTSKEALQFLIDNNIETYTFCTSSNLLFHPKIFHFKGQYRTRVIVGSSNLTKPGLFDNIEASTLIEFANSDKTGIKFETQFLQYFEPILNATDPNTELLTKSLLDDFIKSGFVVDEQTTRDDQDLTKGNNSLFRKREKKKLDKDQLRQISTKDFQKSDSRYEDKITEHFLATWNERLEEFIKFKSENDTVNVPRDYKNPSLYSWFRKNKKFYANNTLPKDLIKQLDDAGFYFGDGHEYTHNKAWEEKYYQLVEIYEQTGSSWLKRIKDKSNPLKPLTDWVAMQRTYQRKGTLAEDRIKRLDLINFEWTPASLGARPDDDRWFEVYMELVDFKKKNGHANPSQVDPNPEIATLGKWVNDQRHLKNNGRKNRKSGEYIYLDPIRQSYLEELGVDWDYELNKHKEAFNNQVQAFLDFREKYPDLKPPTGQFKSERDWRAQMRHKFDKLPDWKQQELKRLNIL